MMPTIVCFVEGKRVDQIEGFDGMGGSTDFPTTTMEWRLALSQVIEYDGDLTQPPFEMDGRTSVSQVSGSGRGKYDDGDDDFKPTSTATTTAVAATAATIVWFNAGAGTSSEANSLRL